MAFELSKPSETAASAPFEIIFEHYDPDDERRRESLLSLGNGLLHCRASAPEEGKNQRHYPGLYRAGCYARLSGRVEGEDVAIDSLANLPSWLPLAFRMEDEHDWISLDETEILDYRQRLDMRTALLARSVTFRDRQGRRTQFHEERFVSMAAPHFAALRTSFTPENWSGQIVIRSGIEAGTSNELGATEGGLDPQALSVESLEEAGAECLLVEATTRGSQVRIATCVRTRILAGRTDRSTAEPQLQRSGTAIGRSWVVDAREGEAIVVEKIAATFTSRDPAIGALSEAALASASDAPSFAALRADHERAWKHLWGRCRIEIDNDNLARALALHAFHLLQTASPHSPVSDAGVPSRGWQEAYHGQIFWDETLSFPFLSLHFPEIARSALIYRHRRLGTARHRAKAVWLEGALYPWRSATTGAEETPAFQQFLPSGRWYRDDTHLQFHVGSAVALNVWQYFLATRDIDFMTAYGAEMIIEIARMWASLAEPHREMSDRFTIRGVVGPDEFHTYYPGADRPGLRDNTYTNVTAAWTLRRALEVLDHLPECHREAVRAQVRLEDEEFGRWAAVANGLCVPLGKNGLPLPFDGFDDLEPFDLQTYEKSHPGARIDWSLEAEGRNANGLQVMKQAQFAMLAYLFPLHELQGLLSGMGIILSEEQIFRTIEADLKYTSHDSSLSDLVYAGSLARLDPAKSWDMFRDALHPDEKAGHSGTEKGVHLGAMAATLDILFRIYLGLRPVEEGLIIDPSPAPDLGRLRVHLILRSNSLTVELNEGHLTIGADVSNHEAVTLFFCGKPHVLEPGGKACFPNVQDRSPRGNRPAYHA